MKRRLLNLLIALDQLVFCLVTLGRSHPDETISAWAWRADQAGKPQGRAARRVIDVLLWFDPEHCKASHESEMTRRQLPAAYRQTN